MPRCLGRLVGSIVAGLAAAAPGAAMAGAPTAASILGSFNLVTSGNAATNSDIEGSAVIGGNLSGSATFFGSRAPGSPAVDLYGLQSGNQNLNNGGDLYDSGSLSGRVNFNGGGHLVSSGPALPLADYTDPLNQLSGSLSAMSANSTAAADRSGAFVFDAAPDAQGYAVFDFTGAALASDLQNQRLQFDENGAKTVVVNVSGSFDDPTSANWNGPALTNVIFNFIGAGSVGVGNWEGSILAPGASVGIHGGAIEGAVFAQSFAGGGELHNLLFTGGLPPTPSPRHKVPEPATLGLFGIGLGALFAARRKRG